MPAYIVAYDLKKHGQNYPCITEKLEAYGTHWHMQASVWIVISTQTVAQIRDNLQQCLDENDELMVARLSGEAAWRGYSTAITLWLKANLK